jgi:hypothetical protein
MLYGVLAEIAQSAACLACGQSSGKLGRAMGLVPPENCKKVLQISPNAPIAIGINEKFAFMISPITSSAESVLLVILLVPPVLQANFIFSPSLSRKSNSEVELTPLVGLKIMVWWNG